MERRKCPDCNGTGKYQLLTSTCVCDECSGSGLVPQLAEDEDEIVFGHTHVPEGCGCVALSDLKRWASSSEEDDL